MAKIKIPQQAGVMLLEDAVTFPHGMLPMHIFEPRYRKMLDDADKFSVIKETSPMICVANLHSNETENPADCVYPVGFIGIVHLAEKDDNDCSNLILQSICRVKFHSWDLSSPYPKATLKPLKNIIEPVTEATELRINSLRDATTRFLQQFSDDIIKHTNDSLDRVNEDLATLTDVIAQQLLFDPEMRQSLLEETQPSERAEALIRHLRIQKAAV